MHHKTTHFFGIGFPPWKFIFVVNGLTHGAKTTRKERTMIILEQAMEIIDADWRNIILIWGIFSKLPLFECILYPLRLQNWS
jgi:hypothetical protein